MKLYYAPGACSLADHIALVEGGLAFETEQVDLKTKRTETGAEYSAINPKGYVPALLLDDGQTLTENIAILAYIADRAGSLAPQSGIMPFRLLETLAFISTEVHKSFGPFFAGAGETEKAAAKEKLDKRLALFEKNLAPTGFLFGEAISVADCYLFVMLFWFKDKLGFALPANIAAYYGRLRARSAFQQALADEGLD